MEITFSIVKFRSKTNGTVTMKMLPCGGLGRRQSEFKNAFRNIRSLYDRMTIAFAVGRGGRRVFYRN